MESDLVFWSFTPRQYGYLFKHGDMGGTFKARQNGQGWECSASPEDARVLASWFDEHSRRAAGEDAGLMRTLARAHHAIERSLAPPQPSSAPSAPIDPLIALRQRLEGERTQLQARLAQIEKSLGAIREVGRMLSAPPTAVVWQEASAQPDTPPARQPEKRGRRHPQFDDELLAFAEARGAATFRMCELHQYLTQRGVWSGSQDLLRHSVRSSGLFERQGKRAAAVWRVAQQAGQ